MRIFSIVFLLLIVLSSFGQDDEYVEEEKPPLSQRISYGGGMSMWFGTETFVFLAPQVFYRFNERLYAGPGFSYTYYRFAPANYSFSSFGASAIGRYYAFKQLFVHAEIEALRGRWEPSSNIPFNIYNLFGGLGYSQSLGGLVRANLMLLYNFNQGPYSPYSNPLFRFGVTIGM